MHPSHRRSRVLSSSPSASRPSEAVRGPSTLRQAQANADAAGEAGPGDVGPCSTALGERGRAVSEWQVLMDKVAELRARQRTLLAKCVEEERLEKRKSAIRVSASHELLRPLSSGTGFTEPVLEAATLADEHRTLRREVVWSATHLLPLLRDP